MNMLYAEPSFRANYCTGFVFFEYFSLLTSVVLVAYTCIFPHLFGLFMLDWIFSTLLSFTVSKYSIFFGEDLTLGSVSYTKPFSDGSLSFRSSK